MKKLLKIIDKGWDIKITNEHRRCETDSSGLDLENGRDHYGLYCWRAKKGNESNFIENEWPGFWKAEDALKDMVNKLK